MTKNKLITISVIVCVLAGAGSFYGGMKYDQSKNSRGADTRFSNLSSEERQTRMQQFATGGQRGVLRANGGLVSGEILSKDDGSITLKLQDGGSKIILFSDSTQSIKSYAVNSEDLEIGKNISVNGTANQDGSITANTIQFRDMSLK